MEKRAGPTRGAVEREAKLIAPAGIGLPDLSGLVPGATAITLPDVLLDAVYYDTADLRLARSGITLRHRDGEPGPAWTVKLPEEGPGPSLARREIRFDGRADHVPDPASDLVLASTRDRVLEPVARLTTLRRPVEIRDRDHQLLAEVVDDTVSVSHGRRLSGRFREVEVELHASGRRGRRLLAAATARLVGAGCKAEPPVPKLVRALGDAARRSPDVFVTPLATDATVLDLVRHAIARSVVQILRHDPGVRMGGDVEDVHQLRVATRRLRSDLRSFASLLEHTQVAGLRAEIAWLGGVVGAVRDADVLAAHLAAPIASLPDVDGPGANCLLGRLERDAGDLRATMLAALRGRRYLHLLDTLVGLAAAPPFIDRPTLSVEPATVISSKIARRPWRRLVDAVGRLGPDPSDVELHRVRILAKRCRYTAEAVAPVVGTPAVRFAAAIADLQTILGDHQDTVVAEAWLRNAAATNPAGCLAAGQLIAREFSERIELRAQWRPIWRTASSKKLIRWL